jgi:hypothetical protein
MTDKFDPGKTIIAALGLQELPEEQRAELLEQATDLVQKRVIIRLLDSLDEGAAKEAEGLSDRPEELLAFLAQRVPDINAVIEEETAKVRDLIIASAEAPGEEDDE